MAWTDKVSVGVGSSTQFLRVGAVGLPPKEELLLRSVVRVLEAQTRRRWEFAEQPPYDVTFVGTGLIAADDDENGAVAFTQAPDIETGISVRVLPHGERPDVDRTDITLPIRPLNLLPLLDTLGDRLLGTPAQNGKRSAKSGSAGTPANGTTSTLAAVRPVSLGLPPSAEAFVSRVRQHGARPFEVHAGGELLLAVDPAARMWTLPSSTSSAAPRVPDLAARFLVIGLEYVDAPQANPPATQGPGQRLEALLWHIGLLATPGEALRPVASRAAFRLTRWPDFGSIGGADAVALKLAALLVSRAHRLDELVASSREPRDRVIDVLNACALCDLFAADVRADAAPAHVKRATPRARRYGLVMHALRTALGMGS